MTWLKNINMLELSPVARPANRKRKLFQKGASGETDPNPSMEDPMITDKELEQYFTKASLPEAVRKAVTAAISALSKAKGEMDDGAFKSVQKALSDVMGFGKKPEEVKKAADDARSEVEAVKDKIVALAKSALEKLQAEQPAIAEAINHLADATGVVPVVKMVAALPPEMKAQWEAMQKNNEDTRKQLAEMQKAIDERDAAASRAQFVTKAAGLAHVPAAKADELGELLHIVTKADAAQGEKLLGILQAVEEAMAKSEVLRELGSSQDRGAKGDAMSKIEAIADTLVQKSDGKMTKEQAITKALELHPELYTQYNEAASARA